MTVELVWHGTVSDDCRLILDKRKEFMAHMGAMKGKRIEVILRRHRAKRSPGQQNYVHGIMFRIAAVEWGWYLPTGEEDVDAVKAYVYREGPMVRRRPASGIGPDLVITESGQTTVEHAKWTNDLRQWFMVEHGINMPEPNEVA